MITLDCRTTKSCTVLYYSAGDDSDEYYEWLIWKIAQKYEAEHNRNDIGQEKRINWSALK